MRRQLTNIKKISCALLQVLSGSVLAKIWLGEITRWNDTAIASLNPNITARLPDADILTSFRHDSAVSSTTVFKRALSVFTNGAFARNGSLVGLPPVANGFSFGYATDAERINYVKVSLRHHAPHIG
jgi:hypothetical protein